MSAKKPRKGALPRKASKRKQMPQRARALDWRPAYLAALTETGVYSWAYNAAGIVSTTPWRERQRNPEFIKQEAEAVKIASRLFESEAVKRAVHGMRKYKFTAAGGPVIDPRTGEQYYESEFSDTVLLKLLSSHIPEVYRDKQDVKLSGEVRTHMTLDQFRQRVATAKANRPAE